MSEAAFDLTGTFPSVHTVYEDATCATMDEESTREQIERVLEADIGGILVGGHSGETELLTMEERLLRLRIARDTVGGRVPVLAGIVANATWAAVEQAECYEEAGADAILVCPPELVPWDPRAGGDYVIAHVRAIGAATGLPLVIFGADNPAVPAAYYNFATTYRRMAEAVPTVAAMKVTTFFELGAFRRTLLEVRHSRPEVRMLQAGSQNCLEAYLNGANGNITNAVALYDLDAAEYQAFTRGDLQGAYEIAKRKRHVTDHENGLPLSRSVMPFHYRAKVAAWLRGIIARPDMRLPKQPITRAEVHEIKDALEAAGLAVVRDPDVCPLNTAVGRPRARAALTE